jgi:hypothetical protein
MNNKFVYWDRRSCGVSLGYPHIPQRNDISERWGVCAGLYNPNTSAFVAGLTAGSTNQFGVDFQRHVSTSGTANATTVNASLYKTATVARPVLLPCVRFSSPQDS